MSGSLFDRFRARDRLALARLLSQVAHGKNLADIAQHLAPLSPSQAARVLAITGSPGVGKSSLIGKLIEHIRGQGLSVAVLACDPQSPYSGGALLGDRFRMTSRPADDGVFIRSLAAVPGSGAVAEHLGLMIRLCAAFGFDVIIVETVGAGQGDTAVGDLTAVVVLLVQPKTGDDLQWEKAGIIEAAEIVVVHKADLPGADDTVSQARAALELSGNPVPVLPVSSKTGEGIDALWQTIVAAPIRPAHGQTESSDLLRLAQHALAERFARAEANRSAGLRQLVEEFRLGRLPPNHAGDAVLDVLIANK